MTRVLVCITIAASIVTIAPAAPVPSSCQCEPFVTSQSSVMWFSPGGD